MTSNCEAGCGHAEWVVTLASCKVFFLCGIRALHMLKLAGEINCPSHIATLEGAAMELACHYTAAYGVEEGPERQEGSDEMRYFERLQWRNRAAE
ncbi:MAG: hypothetical protein ABI779_18420 [Acidobacteriota bacterium]